VTVKARAELVLLGTTLIWGGTFAVTKFGLLDVSPFLLVAIRFTLASLIYLLLFSREVLASSRADLLRGALLGFFLFVGFATQTLGLSHTTASKSAFITSMMVVFVPLLQILIERRAPTVGNIIGVVIVCTGMWLLTSPEEAAFNVGDGLTLVCAIMFAFYIVYLDIASKKTAPVRLSFLQIAVSAVLSIVATPLFETAAFSFSMSLLGVILYLTLLATVLTTYTQTRYQKDTTPTRAVIIFTLEPVFASIIAAVFLSEHLDGVALFGAALIIAGVLVSQLSDSIPVLNRTLGLSRVS
jgi:drug/metabolite transporter (DMT)-like permease